MLQQIVFCTETDFLRQCLVFISTSVTMDIRSCLQITAIQIIFSSWTSSWSSQRCIRSPYVSFSPSLRKHLTHLSWMLCYELFQRRVWWSKEYGLYDRHNIVQQSSGHTNQERFLREDDPLFHKLFTAWLEMVFRKMKW